MHLISLVGKQPMPILIPLWQFENVTDVQFVATEETVSHAENLKQFILQDQTLQGIKIHDNIIVEAYNLSETRSKISQAISKNQHHTVLINYTSGTKIMSLACLLASQEYHSKILYVSTETNRLYTYDHATQSEQCEHIKLNISSFQYFRAHGFDANYNLNFSQLHPPVKIPKEGDFLEEFAFQACLDSGLFSDVQKNVYIQKVLPNGKVVKNELDIVMTYNGNLAVCSCKSGKLDNNVLYELIALSRAEAMGIYCSRFLITSSDANDIKPGIKNRAAEYKIKIISQDLHKDLGEIIFNSLKR